MRARPAKLGVAWADSDLIDASEALLTPLDQPVKGTVAARGFRQQSQLNSRP